MGEQRIEKRHEVVYDKLMEMEKYKDFKSGKNDWTRQNCNNKKMKKMNER